MMQTYRLRNRAFRACAACCVLVAALCLLMTRPAYGERLWPAMDIAPDEVAGLVDTGELSREGLALYRATQEGGRKERIRATERFLSDVSAPEGLVRKIAFQQAALYEKSGQSAAAKRILEEWLAAHPDDAETLELRTWLLDMLVYKGKQLDLSAQERLEQAVRVMKPVCEEDAVTGLPAVRARLMYARGLRLLAGTVAAEWRVSPEARGLPVEARELRANRIVHENALAAERELLALRAILEAMRAAEPEQEDPVNLASPRAEDPIANVLAGVEHELRQAAIAREAAAGQIESL
ncbi:MAG: hypothetical protein JXR94_13535 [Candidatus Hydrogenedentes bacterium]|nr:hypothetical protein [Candidatus Hydrogenedentota bacterium]